MKSLAFSYWAVLWLIEYVLLGVHPALWTFLNPAGGGVMTEEGLLFFITNYSTLEAEELEKLEKQVRPTLLLCFWAGMILSFSDRCLLNFIFSVSFSVSHTHSDTLISNCFCHLLCWEYFPQNINFPFCTVFHLATRYGGSTG